ncbi:MAG: hypothetical protein R3F55_02390 [Alphaproteobacteria bacterium]
MTAVSSEELTFAYHARGHATAHDDKAAVTAQPEWQVHQAHIRCVLEAGREVLGHVTDLGYAVQDQTAMRVMKHGVAKRLSMLWYSFRDITTMAPPDRREPVPPEDMAYVDLALNTIYGNLSLILDGYAEVLARCLGRLRPTTMPPRACLFDPGWPEAGPHWLTAPLQAMRAQYGQWFRDLSAYRELSHRPLPHAAVCTVVYTPAEERAFRAIEAEAELALRRGDFPAAKRHNRELDKLGLFRLHFANPDIAGRNAVYPVVPDDYGALIAVAGAFNLLIARSAVA